MHEEGIWNAYMQLKDIYTWNPQCNSVSMNPADPGFQGAEADNSAAQDATQATSLLDSKGVGAVLVAAAAGAAAAADNATGTAGQGGCPGRYLSRITPFLSPTLSLAPTLPLHAPLLPLLLLLLRHRLWRNIHTAFSNAVSAEPAPGSGQAEQQNWSDVCVRTPVLMQGLAFFCQPPVVSARP
jgi:hypothetical protein